jgi:hypothetical protein
MAQSLSIGSTMAKPLIWCENAGLGAARNPESSRHADLVVPNGRCPAKQLIWRVKAALRSARIRSVGVVRTGITTSLHAVLVVPKMAVSTEILSAVMVGRLG